MTPFILMAEDDPDVQLVTRLALKKAGYRVEAVENGRLLLERLRLERPDLILLDWMMPEMDGPETCSRLKAGHATQDIPVIFMTSRTQAADEAPGRRLGAVGYINKPINPLSVGDEIRRLVAGPPAAVP